MAESSQESRLGQALGPLPRDAGAGAEEDRCRCHQVTREVESRCCVGTPALRAGPSEGSSEEGTQQGKDQERLNLYQVWTSPYSAIKGPGHPHTRMGQQLPSTRAETALKARGTPVSSHATLCLGCRHGHASIRCKEGPDPGWKAVTSREKNRQ